MPVMSFSNKTQILPPHSTIVCPPGVSHHPQTLPVLSVASVVTSYYASPDFSQTLVKLTYCYFYPMT